LLFIYAMNEEGISLVFYEYIAMLLDSRTTLDTQQTILFSISKGSVLAIYHRSLHVLYSTSIRVMKTILSSKESGE